MNEQHVAMQAFEFEQRAVRVEVFDGEPWWVAKDVALALGYAESSDVSSLTSKIPPEWKGHKPFVTPGGVQEIVALSEQGLYFFLARSDKPMALPFQKWVAGEVLPCIRKTGQYAGRPKTQIELLLESVQILADQARLTAALAQRVDAIEARDEARTAVAEQALWALPAPTVEVPTLTVRSQINQLVRQHCVLCGMDYNKAWDALYASFRYRCHLDLPKRAEHANAARPMNRMGKPMGKPLHGLDVAEELESGVRPGTMAQLHAIAFELFGPKAPWDPGAERTAL